MEKNKYLSKIIVAIMAVAVVVCFAAIACSERLTELLGGTGVNMEYETKLFDTSEVMSVDIKMDEDSWNTMLKNAMSEEYYVCDVTINGKTVKNVAIRPKGNTSLSAIAMDPDTNRYSFKLEFDHYVDGQTCYGLDKLILNNNYADATNMKEAVVYDMYQYLGADASLYNYAKVSVNGEYWGVYLALEAVEESFMLRNYGTQDGELYKPDSMDMSGGGGSQEPSAGGQGGPGADASSLGDKTPPTQGGSAGDSASDAGKSDASTSDDAPSQTTEEEGASSGKDAGSSSNRPGQGGGGPSGGFSMGKGGANLNYTDDELDSYSTIWEGEVTGTSKADHRRVVTALKNVNEGTDLETYLDVDNVLKYMAVHAFAVNMDSLSGSMAHNYYLYEYDGQLNMIPWDYNLSFGGMSRSSNSGTQMVNDPIDSPFQGTHFFDALLEDGEYRARYHAYLQQLVDEYVNGGRFDEVYTRIRSQIDELVETDPTAFYSNDEYETAAEMLYEAVGLRAQSIEGQLAGTIPSTTAGQREDSSSLVDGSAIDVTAMGQFDMGFGGSSDKDEAASTDDGSSAEASGGTDSSKDGTNEDGTDAGSTGKDSSGTGDADKDSADGDGADNGGTDESSSSNTSERPSMPDGGGFSFGDMPEGFDPENMPEDFDPNNMPEGFDMSNPPEGFDAGNLPEGFDASNLPEGFDASNLPEGFDASSRPGGGPGFAGGQSSGMAKVKNLIVFALCLVGMLVALVAVKLYKRRRY